MAWKLDKPLYTMSDEAMNDTARKLWEGESLGGIAENNNRLPQPVVWLLALTITTAFAITFPLWGQRPTAELFAGYIKLMDSPAVQAISGDKAKMEYIVANGKNDKLQGLLDRHPVTMDDLRMIKDQVIELERKGVDLGEYTIVGDKVVLANFEGNWKADGTRERKQPWWDKGYTIDIFYVAYFCISVMIVVKRLPHFSWRPDHSIAHGH
jgi:hypothetical protein